MFTSKNDTSILKKYGLKEVVVDDAMEEDEEEDDDESEAGGGAAAGAMKRSADSDGDDLQPSPKRKK